MNTLAINQTGLQQIAAAVQHHTGHAITNAQACAWASEIESTWHSGDSVCFEISQNKTLSGRPEVVRLTPAGFTIAAEEKLAEETEEWEAWGDGARDDAVRFIVPAGGVVDIAEAGAAALGVDVSERLNVARV